MANAVIVEGRSPYELAAGHVEGAITLPLDALAERASELPQGAVVVTVCGKGGGAWHAARALRPGSESFGTVSAAAPPSWSHFSLGARPKGDQGAEAR